MKMRMLRCLLPRPAESVRSNQIDRQITKDHKVFESAVKILLLGTAESGKTTIIKQMRILHFNGYTDEERREKISEIHQNIHESIYQLTKQMTILGLEFSSSVSQKSAQYILSMGDCAPEILDEEYRDNILTLWNDIGIRACYNRSNEFSLLDSTKYFLDNFERISDCSYVPTIDDILHSRKITTGIQEITFRVKIPSSLGGGEQEFRMFDVGGQRDQRNKWIQVFEGIQAVLFLISCSDFDQTLREDPSQNRLTEALNLFRGVWQNRFLSSAGLIVFMNKVDILERKIRAGKRIVDYFPEYEDFRRSPKMGNYFCELDWTRDFIKQKLVDITLEPIKRPSRMSVDNLPRECYYHFTVATDTKNIEKVFKDVHRMILTENLSAVGLL